MEMTNSNTISLEEHKTCSFSGTKGATRSSRSVTVEDNSFQNTTKAADEKESSFLLKSYMNMYSEATLPEGKVRGTSRGRLTSCNNPESCQACAFLCATLDFSTMQKDPYLHQCVWQLTGSQKVENRQMNFAQTQHLTSEMGALKIVPRSLCLGREELTTISFICMRYRPPEYTERRITVPILNY